jgi:hypothetical protein
MKCNVCGHELGKARDLEQKIARAGRNYRTPSDHGIDPGDVNWMCGAHKSRLFGMYNWPDDVPFWYTGVQYSLVRQRTRIWRSG